MNYLKSTISATVLVLFFFIANAQTKITTNVLKADSAFVHEKVSVEIFSILVGSWSGTGLGGKCEEIWLPPVDNAMQGIFRIVKNEKLYFSEYMTILQDSIGFALKVKHFSPDFTGWEDSDKSTDFRFIKAEKNRIYFSGLTFEMETMNKLKIYLAFKQKDKSYKEELFEFTKN